MTFLTCILFHEYPKTLRFDDKFTSESLFQMSAEKHIGRFPTTENNVVK